MNRHDIPSKFHGDRHPRTLNEAFGPYAELDRGPRELPGTRLIPWGVGGLYGLYWLYRVLHAYGVV
jgi:hypothetical protein